MIVTFYSFKGGVGRSMAMANVAEILAGLGYNVVASDWDLEAPGLERYVAPDTIEVERAAAQPGLIDLLAEYKTTLTLPLPQEESGVDTSTTQTHAYVGRLQLRRPSSYASEMEPRGPRPGTLRLLTAGARGVHGAGYGKYAEAVRTFSWTEFYDKWAGGAYMDFLRADLSAGRGESDPLGPSIKPAADIVLIDSRTGVTEHGGVATHHLADVVVLMSAANDLNVEGTSWMADALADPKLTELRSGRKLAVLPVPSRIEQTSEKNLLGQFRKTFADAFCRRLPGSVLTAPDEFFVDIEIPYMPFYSFTERVAAREVPPEREVRLYRAYEALAHAIIRCGFELNVLEKRPIETSSRFQMPPTPASSPRGMFTLVTPHDMRAPADMLGRLLNQAQISVSSDQRSSNALARPAVGASVGALILIGPETSPQWARAAFDTALRRQALSPDFRIVPIVDPAVRLSALPFLSRVRIVQASLGSDSTDVAPIVAALASAAPPASEDASTPPFPGLRPYEESDARLYFGRDALLFDLGARLASATTPVRWLHVDGPSGSGKTSFVLASVIPALRLGVLLPGITCGPVAVCRAGVDPLGSLAVALAMAAGDPEATMTIREALGRPGGLMGEIQRLTPPGQTFVLFLDDAHVQGVSGPMPQLLREAVASLDSKFLLITAADSGWSSKFPGPADHAVQCQVGMMSVEEFGTAATAPARLAGITWEPEALGLLMFDVEAMKDSTLTLPLFAAAVRAVWENRSGTRLTAAAYQQLGAFVPALLRHAEKRIEELTPERLAAAKRLLVNLSAPRRDGGSERKSISRAEATALAGGGAEGDWLITLLAVQPAVVTAGDRVTLSHDVLLDRWTRLQHWIAEARAVGYRRETATWTRKVALAAGLMIALVAGVLWSASRTERARLESRRLAEAALQAQDADPLRGLAFAVAAAANADTDQARSALKGALADVYPRVVLHHPAPVIDASFNADGSRVITTAEDNITRVWDAVTGRAAAVPGGKDQAIELKTPARVTSVRASLSRPIAAMAGFDGTVTLLDTSNGQTLAQLRGHSGPVVGVDFSSDGRLLATASFDGTALVWDVESRKAVVELKGHTAAVTSVLFRNDGKELLTTSLDATGRLWSVDGKPIATLLSEQAVHLGAFGGNRAAVGGSGGAIVRPAAGPDVQILQGNSVAGLAFLAGGDKVVTASPYGVSVWDAADGRVLGTFATATNAEGDAPQFTDLAVDQKGGRIAAATAQGRVYVWDSASSSGAPVAVLRAHTLTVNRVAFTSDGRFLLTASNDDTVCIWDTRPPAVLTDQSFSALLQAGQSIVARVFTTDQLATLVRKD